MNQSALWIGPGTLDKVSIKHRFAKGKKATFVISGVSIWSILTVSIMLVAVAMFLVFLKRTVMSLPFFLFAVLLPVIGIIRKGDFFCFEKKWLILEESSIVFRDGSVWDASEIREISCSVKQVNNIEGGTMPGWAITIEGRNNKTCEFHFVLKSDFELFWNEIVGWASQRSIRLKSGGILYPN